MARRFGLEKGLFSYLIFIDNLRLMYSTWLYMGLWIPAVVTSYRC